MKITHAWRHSRSFHKALLLLAAFTALALLVYAASGHRADNVDAPPFHLRRAMPPQPPALQYLRYECRYGRLGNRVMSFVTALAIARANGRLLVVDDPVLLAFFDVSAFARDLAPTPPASNLATDRTSYFRDGRDLAAGRRFANHLLRSEAPVVDLGIAYDYAAVPLPPSIWNALRLHRAHVEAAEALLADRRLARGAYDCLHHRGTDFAALPNFVPIEDAAAVVRRHLLARNDTSSTYTLFVTTDEREQLVRRTLDDLLPQHRLLFAPDGELRFIEDELWAVGTIGVSLAVCAHARTLFLNPSSTFSHLIGTLASSTSHIVYMAPTSEKT